MKIYKAKFIGTDGSMGLRKGQVYPLKIWEEPRGFFGIGGRYIIVSWYAKEVIMALSGEVHGVMKCPYSNINAFLNNWEVVNERPKKANKKETPPRIIKNEISDFKPTTRQEKILKSYIEKHEK